ncbi:MAG: hypothetical protein WCY01_10230 [Alkalispirochaeta sp.]
MAQIGIKLADHSFYPVLDDEKPQRKRLVLTVARDGQESVQVDLLRRGDNGDQLVGCLVLEGLPGDAGVELEFILGLDGDGNVDARISDSSGRQFQSLSANLSQLEIESPYGLPEELLHVPDVDYDDEILEDMDDEEDQIGRAGRHRRFNPVVLVAVVLIVLGITLVGAYFVFMILKGDPLPELRASVSMVSTVSTVFPAGVGRFFG